MADSYWDKIDKLIEVADKNSYMDLKDFISTSLSASGFDVEMMNNVYINEVVNYPDVFGVYQEDNKLFSYVNNSYGEKKINEYDTPANFMVAFVLTAPNMKKYGESNNNLKK